MHDLETFLAAYIEAALWSTSGTTPEGEDIESLEGYELSARAEECMRRDCATFLERYGHLISEDTCLRGAEEYGAEGMAGHDFWLTRNGHGCGFWDGDWSEPEAEQLTEASKRFGEVYLYIGDDGMVHVA